jgi:hypothetical protein
MKVFENTGTTVTVELETEEAVKLSGGEGFTNSLVVQNRLRDQLTASWVEGDRRPTKDGEP